ncbi:MAG: DUF4215 domain-containing protein [Deltaproteobacteria bacterium]|nr:DUF4215 domain-containing protein [Deltaproteobacteria bacterium]MBW2417891.1 DUF4215 domain-containing protein [Deltaproteobacteria bacterium]
MSAGSRGLPRWVPWAMVVLVLLALGSDRARAGAYVFAGEGNGVDRITHPQGYNGNGGVVTVDVCIARRSPNAALMEIPVQNVINTFQSLIPTTQNVKLGGSNDLLPGEVDFESVALHELGHCLGMAHVNLASESGFANPQADGTKTTDGSNDAFNVSAGPDGLMGSADDLRGDDVNLHWFRKADNNPFGVAAIVDSTTYSRDLSDLPAGDGFAVNGDRNVASALGLPGTEAVMQQLTFYDEAQRTITGDEVATLRLAMAGLDEIEGTADDYTLDLRYLGLRNSCDVKIEFDDSQTSFAQCETGGAFLGDHTVITSAKIHFNTGYAWHFTPSITPICGDGVLEGAEECDDAAAWAGDGCSSGCEEEAGWICSGQPSTCVEVCGDGVPTPSESCDDGNNVSGDCCSALCQFEAAGSSCDDGDPCAVNDACDGAAACESGDAVDCDDGAFCNGAELCTPGVGCEPGVPPLLDDAIACTADACDEVSQSVTHIPDDLICEDANACTADSCDVLTGCAHGVVVCDDGDPCTIDACDSEVGCMHAISAACSGVPGFSRGGHALLAALILAMGGLALAPMTLRRSRGIIEGPSPIPSQKESRP